LRILSKHDVFAKTYTIYLQEFSVAAFHQKAQLSGTKLEAPGRLQNFTGVHIFKPEFVNDKQIAGGGTTQ